MCTVKRIRYYDKAQENIFKNIMGGFVDLLLDYDDKRFNNIPAPLVDGIENYRDLCGVYAVCDRSMEEQHRLGRELIFKSPDGDDYIMGELTKSEYEDLAVWLDTYGTLDFKELGELEEELTFEELCEKYYGKTEEFKIGVE